MSSGSSYTFSSCCWMCQTQIQPAHCRLIPSQRSGRVAWIMHIPGCLLLLSSFPISQHSSATCDTMYHWKAFCELSNLFRENHPGTFLLIFFTKLVILSALLHKSSSKKWDHNLLHLAHTLKKKWTATTTVSVWIILSLNLSALQIIKWKWTKNNVYGQW